MATRLIRALLAATAIVLMFAGEAGAHAAISDTDPKSGTKVTEAPDALHIEYTEPPTGDATITVSDGCGRDVVEGLDIQNLEIDATLVEGQPGVWKVDSSVISGLDGHLTKESFRFSVAGKKDCSGDPSPAAGGPEREDSSGAPLLPIAGATVAIVAIALFVRSRSGNAETN